MVCSLCVFNIKVKKRFKNYHENVSFFKNSVSLFRIILNRMEKDILADTTLLDLYSCSCRIQKKKKCCEKFKKKGKFCKPCPNR